MKTSYGLHFETVNYINSDWSEYDKAVAAAHLARFGKIVTDEYRCPIDNEHDLEEIHRLIK